jgi:hypothetical protein
VTNENKLNMPLIRKTMEYIYVHPHSWDQGAWVSETSCGTTMCFAGTAALLAGATLDPKTDTCTSPDGYIMSIQDYAAQELGLDWAQEEEIFFGNADTPEEMQRIVERAIGERL